MKYFNYTNNHLEEVDSSYYEVWHSLFAYEYMLEDYVYVGRDAGHTDEIKNKKQKIRNKLKEENQNKDAVVYIHPLSFVVFYDKDELRITEDGVEAEVVENVPNT